jgi:hypothetical protein
MQIRRLAINSKDLPLASCLRFCSALKEEEIRSFETSVDLYRATWTYILEDNTCTIQSHCCKNLKSNNSKDNPTWVDRAKQLNEDLCRYECSPSRGSMCTDKTVDNVSYLF